MVFCNSSKLINCQMDNIHKTHYNWILYLFNDSCLYFTKNNDMWLIYDKYKILQLLFKYLLNTYCEYPSWTTCPPKVTHSFNCSLLLLHRTCVSTSTVCLCTSTNNVLNVFTLHVKTVRLYIHTSQHVAYILNFVFVV